MIELPPRYWDEENPGRNEQAQQLRWIIDAIEKIVADLNDKEKNARKPNDSKP